MRGEGGRGGVSEGRGVSEVTKKHTIVHDIVLWMTRYYSNTPTPYYTAHHTTVGVGIPFDVLGSMNNLST